MVADSLAPGGARVLLGIRRRRRRRAIQLRASVAATISPERRVPANERRVQRRWGRLGRKTSHGRDDRILAREPADALAQPSAADVLSWATVSGILTARENAVPVTANAVEVRRRRISAWRIRPIGAIIGTTTSKVTTLVRRNLDPISLWGRDLTTVSDNRRRMGEWLNSVRV